MFRSVLNEIKNTVISHASSQLQGALNNLAGNHVNFNQPRGRGGVSGANYAGAKDPFANETVIYPEDLGNEDSGHYVLFNINEQTNANVEFGGKGKHIQSYSSKASEKNSQNKQMYGSFADDASVSNNNDLTHSGAKDQMQQSGKSTISVPQNATRRLKSCIAMYMPASVSVSQASQYQEAEIGAFAAAGVGLAKSLSSAPNAFDNPTDFMKKGADAFMDAATAAGSQENMALLGEKSIRAGLDIIPGLAGVGAAHDISRGFVRNNRLEMVFSGIGRRSFSFSFKCMPKSEKEAIDVDKIVRMFRFYMAPSFMNDVSVSTTMIVPATFDISYLYAHGKRNNFLNKISTCVLESCNVTYGGERVQFFRPTNGMEGDGAPPVETQIDLQFKELEVITRERIGVGY